ncbi:MAG: hypothetical protein ACLP4V_16700 [Methylocella sp.]
MAHPGNAARRDRQPLIVPDRTLARRPTSRLGPLRPAQRPWLAEGCSRSPYYRRRAKARQEAALAETFERAESFAMALARDLERCALAHAVMARELSGAHPPSAAIGDQAPQRR